MLSRQSWTHVDELRFFLFPSGCSFFLQQRCIITIVTLFTILSQSYSPLITHTPFHNVSSDLSLSYLTLPL